VKVWEGIGYVICSQIESTKFSFDRFSVVRYSNNFSLREEFSIIVLISSKDFQLNNFSYFSSCIIFSSQCRMSSIWKSSYFVLTLFMWVEAVAFLGRLLLFVVTFH
jgi:hypothetical protein